MKKVFLKISQNLQEAPVAESLFNKFNGFKPLTLLKGDSITGNSCGFYENLNTFFTEHFWATISALKYPFYVLEHL